MPGRWKAASAHAAAATTPKMAFILWLVCAPWAVASVGSEVARDPPAELPGPQRRNRWRSRGVWNTAQLLGTAAAQCDGRSRARFDASRMLVAHHDRPNSSTSPRARPSSSGVDEHNHAWRLWWCPKRANQHQQKHAQARCTGGGGIWVTRSRSSGMKQALQTRDGGTAGGRAGGAIRGAQALHSIHAPIPRQCPVRTRQTKTKDQTWRTRCCTATDGTGSRRAITRRPLPVRTRAGRQ